MQTIVNAIKVEKIYLLLIISFLSLDCDFHKNIYHERMMMTKIENKIESKTLPEQLLNFLKNTY